MKERFACNGMWNRTLIRSEGLHWSQRLVKPTCRGKRLICLPQSWSESAHAGLDWFYPAHSVEVPSPVFAFNTTWCHQRRISSPRRDESDAGGWRIGDLTGDFYRNPSHRSVQMEDTVYSTFFGMVVRPNFKHKAALKNVLLLTRAVIAPEASPSDWSRLFLSINKSRVVVCQLDGRTVTSVPLNIQLFPGTDVVFSVAGSAAIHLSGFYEPKIDPKSPDFATARGFDLIGSRPLTVH
jgi:hypothetical protein